MSVLMVYDWAKDGATGRKSLVCFFWVFSCRRVDIPGLGRLELQYGMEDEVVRLVMMSSELHYSE